jgi:ABC-type Fe3+/spermidine/putrescine transport system ATPase subunit
MLEVREIFKMYEGKPLLRGVSFTVSAGETVCLLGPSGSGKSTLLRIIAGLEAADAGQVLWDGQNLLGMPVHQRRFGLMFQDYALFPHKSVYENVAFGLRMQGMPKDEIEVRVQEGLQQVNMKAFAQRRVTDLSGGEQQRVALARALAPRPRLLMLDEPLGALDRTLREQLTEELHQLLQSSGVPAIYVTHDQEEAFAIGDRLILLNNGLVTQEGSPDEVYQRPNSMWAARFLGLSNLLPGEVVSSAPLQVQTELGRMPASCAHGDAPAAGSQVTLLLRPWGAGQSADSAQDFPLQGEVEDVVFRVEGFRVTLRVRPDLSFQFYMDERLETGQWVTLHLPPEGIYCLPETAPAEGDGL